MRTAELRKFARAVGMDLTPYQSGRIMKFKSVEACMLVELCDRWMTGELVLRVTIPARRERVDRTPVIDVITMNRKYRGMDAATRIPFVKMERVPDGWVVEEGRTVVHRRGRRYEVGRELKVHDPVYLWDERKVLWEEGALK